MGCLRNHVAARILEWGHGLVYLSKALKCLACCCSIAATCAISHGSELACWLELGGVSVPQLVLYCCWLGQPVSTWQVEMGWPYIHWLARDRMGWWQPL
jgi:hypothetical protein